MKIRPTEDRVVVEREPEDRMLSEKADLVAPDQFARQNRRGKVIAMGPGKLNTKGSRLPMSVSLGDTVTWGLYVSMEVTRDMRGAVEG